MKAAGCADDLSGLPLDICPSTKHNSVSRRWTGERYFCNRTPRAVEVPPPLRWFHEFMVREFTMRMLLLMPMPMHTSLGCSQSGATRSVSYALRALFSCTLSPSLPSSSVLGGREGGGQKH